VADQDLFCAALSFQEKPVEDDELKDPTTEEFDPPRGQDARGARCEHPARRLRNHAGKVYTTTATACSSGNPAVP
jgi:hypothetical protein